MPCNTCTPNNPHSEFTEEHYDYEYVDSEYVHKQKCSCYYDEDEEERGYAYYKKAIAEETEELEDVSDIIAALKGMDPCDDKQVAEMIDGIIYEQEEEDAEGYDGIRLINLEPQVYVSDYVDLLKLLRGDFSELVNCERTQQREHGSKDPYAVLEMMKTLVEGDVEIPTPAGYEQYSEHRVCTYEYDKARLHELHVVYEEDFEEFTFVIDRAMRKVYVKA